MVMALYAKHLTWPDYETGIEFSSNNKENMNCFMRKTGVLHICENKDADKRLCSCYTDSTILLLSISEISNL